MAQELSLVAEFADHVELSEAQAATLQQVYVFVEAFFRNPKFDASHDFGHVERVTRNALALFDQEKESRPLDPFTVLLGALLHDVEDKKYSSEEELGQSAIETMLVSCCLPHEHVSRIKKLVDGVSYSSEVKDPAKVQRRIQEIPELAIVQDADRLDAIGAIGIARCFTFGGAKAVRSIDDTVQHFRDKLLKLEGMMKTESGREMAAERSRRIEEFMSWWQDECGSQL